MLARSLFACGSAAVFDADVARQYFAEAIGLARALGDRWRLSQIRGRQAHAAFVAGDPIAARAIAEEGRELADAIGDRFESRQCRFRLAGARCFEGDLVGAIAPFRELLAEAEANHDVMFRVTLLTLGHAEAYYGDTAAARAAADAAIEAAAELGDFYVGAANTALVVAALAAGDVALASDAADAAWQGISTAGPGTAALNRGYIAQAALARGELNEARRWADDAVAETTGWYRAVALTTRARVAVAQGERDQVERDVYEALVAAVGVEAYLGVPDTLEVLAGLAADAGSHREAGRLLGAADGIRKRTGEVRFKVYDLGTKLR